MILNKQQIIEEYSKGNIVYVSLLDNQLDTNCKNQSVDVNIGDWIYIPSLKHREMVKDCGTDGWLIIDPKSYITIPEGVFFLCYTEQFIGTIKGSNIHTQWHLRSTIARLGLGHGKAGWGDTGFHNRWCMEFQTMIDFDLYPNMRVGQISFEYACPSDSSYTQETGNYQNDADIADIVANWKKEDILPKKSNF